MNIGIVGQGFVGNAIYQKFKDYYDVFTYDLDEHKCNSTKSKVYSCDIVFICLPTPMGKDGKCYTGIVENVIKELQCKIAVIKSTIIPGTTDELNKKYPHIDIVHNPEFLTERNAVEDFKNQNRIILGGPRPATTKLKQMYSKVFPKAVIVKTGAKHAEMVKYFTNSFLATKVSFANDMYKICNALGLDYDKVVEYATYDDRLGKSHWSVPGPDGDFGYGGICFPKDVRALVKLSDEINAHSNILSATEKTNYEVRKNKDWEKAKGRSVL